MTTTALRRSFLFITFIVSVLCKHRIPPQGSTKWHNHEGHELCAPVVCEGGDIPKECRKPQFLIGYDGETMCRICDATFCGRREEVCPRLICPEEKGIKPLCRKPNFIIGTDDITRCRVCDTNACGDYKDVCPSVYCPMDDKIKPKCRIKQYMIGRDGITRCKICHKDACKGVKLGLRNTFVEHHNH